MGFELWVLSYGFRCYGFRRYGFRRYGFRRFGFSIPSVRLQRRPNAVPWTREPLERVYPGRLRHLSSLGNDYYNNDYVNLRPLSSLQRRPNADPGRDSHWDANGREPMGR